MAGRIGTLMLAAGLVALTSPVHGATFTIDDTADQVDAAPGDGACATAAATCTVRAAIQEANALPGADTIVVDPLLSGSVTLAIPGAGEDAAATGDLDVTDDLTFDGQRPAGNGIATLGIAGNGLDRVLHVLPGVTATITNVDVRDGATGPGEHGGCILNEGTLDGHIVVQLCHAGGDGGGLYNAGTADVASRYRLCTADGNGGGIANTGTLKLRRDIYYASIARNSAASGGGIWNAGTISGNALSIMENQATAGPGGGLLNETGAVARLANLTVGANTATSGGAGIENRGAADLRYVTVNAHAPLGVRNDDGAGATSSVLGAIIADPCDGTLASGGHNVTAGCALAGAQPSDQMGVDPQLGSHADCAARYAPDVCPNYRPHRGSPAIDAGDPADCNDAFGAPLVVDQWGIDRPTGPACDAGAIETMPACSGGATATTGQLVIAGLGAGPGRQSIRFFAHVPEDDLPSLAFFGAQLVVDDLGSGAPLFDRSAETASSLPGGGAIPFSCQQWRRTGAGYAYREIDHDCPHPPVGGVVRSLRVKDQSDAPTSPYVDVKATLKQLSIGVPTGPFDVSFVYGWYPHFSEGKCAKASFGPTACVRKAATLRCRF